MWEKYDWDTFSWDLPKERERGSHQMHSTAWVLFGSVSGFVQELQGFYTLIGSSEFLI